MAKYGKLDPEFKARWVEALESDRYEQGQSALKTHSDKFCCLGVAADLKDPDGWYEAACNIEHYWAGGCLSLRDNARKEISLSRDAQNELIRMNDDGKMTFTEIAKWIKENL